MPINFDITSANSKVELVNVLFPAGLSFEGYSVDSASTMDLIQQIEARMGVDGKIAFGYTPSPKPISFIFQPNSPTVDRLDYLVQTQDTLKQPIVCQMTILLKSLGKRVVLENGACTNNKLIPNMGRVLEPMQYDFVFQTVNIIPL